MMKHDDRVYLQHILDSIAHIETFTEGALENLHKTPVKWFATLHVLQTLSESATKLSIQAKEAMAGIEWQRINGFRNVLVHDYLGDIDPLIIRKVVEIELPKLKKEAKNMLERIGKL